MGFKGVLIKGVKLYDRFTGLKGSIHELRHTFINCENMHKCNKVLMFLKKIE